MKRAALIVAVALAFPVSASAAPFTPALNYAYSMAVHHWGAGPTSCTSIDKEIVDDGAIGDFRGEATQPELGQIEPCHLYVIAELAQPNYFEAGCAVMRHEVGHLLGFGHSTDPRSIMYPEVTFIPSECDRAMLTVMNHPRRFR